VSSSISVLCILDFGFDLDLVICTGSDRYLSDGVEGPFISQRNKELDEKLCTLWYLLGYL
jgi:hypothetical protein